MEISQLYTYMFNKTQAKWYMQVNFFLGGLASTLLRAQTCKCKKSRLTVTPNCKLRKTTETSK